MVPVMANERGEKGLLPGDIRVRRNGARPEA